jgi:ATP-dependent Clp protease ATP-binding subunit ClpA
MEKIGFATNTSNPDKENYAEAKTKINSALKDYFRPEFLNRIDDTIIFDILSPEAIRKIVTIQVDQLIKRLAEKSIELALTPAVYDLLSKEGYNPQYGARPLKRLIQTKILTPVANLLIGQEVVKGGKIQVDLKGDKFTFEVKKKHLPAGRQGKGESPIIVQEMVGQK